MVDYEGKGWQTIIQGILVRRKSQLWDPSLGLPGRGQYERGWHKHWGKRTGHDFHLDGHSRFIFFIYLFFYSRFREHLFASLFSCGPYSNP